MKSLSFKLVALYVISAFFIVIVTLSFVDYTSFRDKELNAQLLMEAGPGYINGVLPKDLEAQAQQKYENINEVINSYINGLKFNDVVNKYKPILDTLTPVSASNSISIAGPIPMSNSYYKAYTLEMSRSQIGTVVLTDNYFPSTINSFNNLDGTRRLYYVPVAGYNDLVIVASVDIRFLPGQSWPRQLLSDIWPVMPLVIVCAALSVWVISKNTVQPIKRIAQVTEELSERHLAGRVEVKSNDEIGSLAKSFNRMADRLQASFDSQKRLISDAAHGLKTPLASMKLSVTEGLSENKNVEEYQQILSFISGRIETQNGLINDLLFLARADEGRSKIERQSTNLSDVANDAEEVFRYLFDEKNIQFTTRLEPEAPIQADAKLLMHLISNLLENALKNTPVGGEVAMTVAKTRNQVMLEIRDNGVGIPAECLDHIFERFYQVPNQNTTNNSFGLGLAICKSIADFHKAEISVESQINAGSVFKVAFKSFSDLDKSQVSPSV